MRRRIFLRCFSKHAFESVGARVWASLAQHSGCPKLQASRCLRCKAAHAPQNKPNWDCQHCCSKHALPNQPGWPLGFCGRSEQRSDSRLSNALADQSYSPLPINMPFPELSPKHCTVPVNTSLPAIVCQTCRAKHAGLTVGLLRSVWATPWHSLEQRSSWPRPLIWHNETSAYRRRVFSTFQRPGFETYFRHSWPKLCTPYRRHAL